MLNLDASDNFEGIASITNVVEFTFSGVDGTTVVSKEGKLTDGQTTIHTAVGITRVYSLTLVNTHSAAVTVTVTKDPANAGTLYKLFSISLGIGYSLVFDGARFAVFDANGILMNGSAASDTAYAASWDGVTNITPSKNAVYDQMELKAPKASPTFTGTVTAPSIAQTNAIENKSKLLQTEDIFSDFVVGAAALLPATSANLTSDISEGKAYVTGTRVVKAVTSKTYTASKDTYVDVNSVGVYTFVEVALGAAAPAVTADSIRLAKVVTSDIAITGVTDLRELRITTGKDYIHSVLTASYPVFTDADKKLVSKLIETANVAANAVTYAKMQNVSATDKLLGRATAGAGDTEEIACTAAGRALIDDADAAAQRATLGAAPLDSPSFTGPVGIGGQLTISGASRMRATRATAQSIPNATWTNVQYDTEAFDNLNEYDNATNYRFTAKESGYYFVSASLLSTSVAWGVGKVWQIAAWKNGAIFINGVYFQAEAATTKYRHAYLNDAIYLAANDYIDIRVTQDQGAAVNTHTNVVYNYFLVHRLS